MVSSVISASKASKRRHAPSGKPSRRGKPDDASNSYTSICLTIFIFRGEPDFYFNRRVLLYFTSPDDPKFHETVHAQRNTDEDPWVVDRIHVEINWAMTITYYSHVNAGAVLVQRGQEMVPVDVVAATPVVGREEDGGWNCQNFLLEGLQGIVSQGFQTQEWYHAIEGELADRLIDGAIG